MPNRKVFGLTGGIASGKSSVAKMLEDEGFSIVDADKIAKRLREPGGRAEPEIQKAFGTVEPEELRNQIFSDPAKKKQLEAILHPLIREDSIKMLSDLQTEKNQKPIIYEAALLVEAGRSQEFDGLIVVSAPEELRTQRLMKRDGSSEESAKSVIASQISDQERRKHATHFLTNDQSLEELKRHVKALAQKLCA